MNLLKLRCKNKEKEVYHDKDYLCCFGVDDLNIKNDCNILNGSCSSLGDEYEKSSTIKRYALAGSYNFKVLEIEVYKVL